MTSGKPKNPSQALTALLTAGAPARSSRLGVAAVVVLGVTLAALAWLAVPLLRPHRPDSAAGEPKTLNQDEAAAKFDETMTRNLAQIEGRSAFYLPLKNAKVEAPSDKPVAKHYGGPQIVAMVNNAVWFAGGERIEVGKSDKSGDLSVLSISAPWSAKVRWQGGEFTVEFFQRSPLLTGKTEGWKTTFYEDGTRPLAPRPASPAAAGASAPRESVGSRGRANGEGQGGDGPSVIIEIPAMEEPSHENPPPATPAPRPQPSTTPATPTDPGSTPEPAPPPASGDPEPHPAPAPSAPPSTEPEKQRP
ncbi:MAG: hypothetical protein IT438_09520 [Phycisphaerales bacterium]|nr:hypothetical protein [Phycisphaerales bacterium]